ncbi:serine/threonine-protein phosphatase [Lentzea tibetensis]|uniref:Serine/threonine-protein phosphatase n=1 Tax=Lentzea tibetensis TaxID=2591470 RepID=A0A563F026_9PSEU|nr:protein phosphatase 2C domain-containing protein [Lentzea tibetensis]TWP53337.1 serine/threonine-protein phosphatase [Lentzea tibetensis]
MTHELRVAAASDPGLMREQNEDAYFAGPDLQAVADGMGGHAHGEVASGIAIDVLETFAGDLGAAVAEIARRLDLEAPEGTGTTLTAMRWNGLTFELAHIGDSRAYLLRAGELIQISHDHTMVQALVDAGRMTPEEALNHPRRAYVIRALQSGGSHEPDITLHEAKAGDRYLLCSDGLTDYSSIEDVGEVLASVEDGEEAAWRLVALANGNGGPDNITCVITDVVKRRWYQRY